MNGKKEVLKTKEIFAYACTTAVTMGTILIASFVSGYWTDVVGISMGAVGVILLVTNIFDGLSDLVMGVIVDKTHTRHGKAKPWLFIGSIGVIITSTLIFITPDIPMTGKIIYASVMYFLAGAVFATMTNVATPTLVNLMTTDTDERFKLGSWLFSMMFFVYMVLGFGLNVIMALGGGQKGYFKFALLCNIVAAILMIFCWFNIKERHGQEVTEKSEKVDIKEFFATIFSNKYFFLVMGMYFLTNIANGASGGAQYYYVMYVLKNPTAFGILSITSYGACIIGTLIAPAIGKKVGVTKLVIISNFVTALTYILAFFRPTDLVYVVVLGTIGSFANGPACAVLSPYNAMAADYGEYKSGVARPAIYSAGTSVGTKLGMGFGGMLFSFILTATGYDGFANVQNSATLTSISVVYFLVFAVIMLLNNLMTAPFLKLEKEYGDITAELKSRHAESEPLR